MRFLETRVFTDAIAELIPDDDYAALQAALISRPHLGVRIPGGAGIRKLRWYVPGRGKRGGLRVIYFWEPQPEVFFMLYAYPKSERDDLSRLQLRLLRRIVEQELS